MAGLGRHSALIRNLPHYGEDIGEPGLRVDVGHLCSDD